MSRFSFHVLSKSSWVPRQIGTRDVYLRSDDWDDYGYRTTFFLSVFDDAIGRSREIGAVKIAKIKDERRPTLAAQVRTDLPPRFDQLDPEYGSLAQDVSFYTDLMSIFGESETVNLLQAFGDLTLRPTEFDQQTDPTGPVERSLLRFVTRKIVQTQYRRVLRGHEQQAPMELSFKPRGGDASETFKLQVEPESSIPTNLHVIIGANGTGKSTLLYDMEEQVRSNGSSQMDGIGYFTDSSYARIPSIVTVRFSTFDAPRLLTEPKSQGVRVVNVALDAQVDGRDSDDPTDRDLPIPSTADGQATYFRRTVQALLTDRKEELAHCLDILKRADRQLAQWGLGDVGTVADLPFSKLSSGHKVVLLSTISLIRYCEEGTLVLLDEPEGHLHPPLLSAFIRLLSEVLRRKNGFAIIATHSPVVLQEVPRSCVSIIQQFGQRTAIDRPVIETFGESVDVLTREIFGLELRESGFYTILARAADSYQSYEEAEASLGGNIGGEARMILRAMTRTQSARS